MGGDELSMNASRIDDSKAGDENSANKGHRHARKRLSVARTARHAPLWDGFRNGAARRPTALVIVK